MGIAGLWLGMSIGCIILDFGFALIIGCPNWTEIGAKMREQIEKGKQMRTPEQLNYRANFSQKSDHSRRKDERYDVPTFSKQNEGGEFSFSAVDSEEYIQPNFKK